MYKKIDWDSQVGRRLRLRDLHVFLTVTQHGSMGKAAAQLGVTAPTVSEVIADLEHGLGVRLFDRSRQGVEPTSYGRALLKRAVIVFDELKQSIRDIEFLSDPTVGEVKVGCSDSISATFLLDVIRRYSQEFPRVTLRVDAVPNPAAEFPRLRDRTYDLIMVRWLSRHAKDHHTDNLKIELLFDDPLIVTAGARSRWERRRRIDLRDLIDAPWFLPADTWSYSIVAEAFQSAGLNPPNIQLVTMSVQLRAELLADSACVTIFPTSVARRYGLKILPVHLPAPRWQVAMITLKDRSLSPVVELFIERCRKIGKKQG